jgi:sodium/potassium-transporting ATPase subunit alpha
MEEIKTILAKKRGVRAATLENVKLSKQEEEEGAALLLDAEAKLPIGERRCVGDASETGLIKFCEPLKPLDKARADYPVFQYNADGKLNECFIPFSSEIKFNLYIRDMNKAVRHPTSREDNLMVIMKGAPERILKRCTKILINEEERDFDKYW